MKKANLIVILFLLHFYFPSMAQESNSFFTLIEIPSSYHNPAILSKQIHWIQKNVEREHIDFVIHAGDLVPRQYVENDWIVASQTLHLLDDIVPYFVLTGNHEIFPGKDSPRERNYELFKKYFPIPSKQNYTCFGENYPNSDDNAYFIITKNKMALLLICLEYAPREEILDWANRVISKHNDLKVIITTHCYTNSPNSLNNWSWNPVYINRNNKDRDEIWEKLIKQHKNIFLVLSYHYKGLRREASIGKNGNIIHQLLANYLNKDLRNDGWLRIMKFYPDKNKVTFFTYSPIKNEYLRDSENQFEITF